MTWSLVIMEMTQHNRACDMEEKANWCQVKENAFHAVVRGSLSQLNDWGNEKLVLDVNKLHNRSPKQINRRTTICGLRDHSC